MNPTNTNALRRIQALIVAFTLAFSAVAQADQPRSEAQKDMQPNVLFIAIDDLNDWMMLRDKGVPDWLGKVPPQPTDAKP
ncbi:hypothetical protein SH528x_005665 [Novipirellula sp. SH528]|uniref:hypothetical protein n=1 Tax=Novipirellula sp. SH528 TaxID=3454466 RepID=UPI003F9FD485